MFKKIVKCFMFVSFLSCFSSLVIASPALCENCEISIVQPDSSVPGTLIYANVNGAWAQGGTCSSTSSQKRMYILQSEPMEDQLYSAALTAIAGGLKVDIKGTGVCRGDIEVIRFIKIKH